MGYLDSLESGNEVVSERMGWQFGVHSYDMMHCVVYSWSSKASMYPSTGVYNPMVLKLNTELTTLSGEALRARLLTKPFHLTEACLGSHVGIRPSSCHFAPLHILWKFFRGEAG